MKKIINGKLYNTETAKEVAKDWNGYSTWDFNYLCETLYLNEKSNPPAMLGRIV